jgi:hypothetical protein
MAAQLVHGRALLWLACGAIYGGIRFAIVVVLAFSLTIRK